MHPFYETLAIHAWHQDGHLIETITRGYVPQGNSLIDRTEQTLAELNDLIHNPRIKTITIHKIN